MTLEDENQARENIIFLMAEIRKLKKELSESTHRLTAKLCEECDKKTRERQK